MSRPGSSPLVRQTDFLHLAAHDCGHQELSRGMPVPVDKIAWRCKRVTERANMASEYRIGSDGLNREEGAGLY